MVQRYNMEAEPVTEHDFEFFENVVPRVEPVQNEMGEWVKWEDVQELIETLRDSRMVIDGVCDEYRGYLIVLRKIDSVLSKWS